ncbi:hypothetical protein L226DRAFT_521523 [Lentinus tigrinus ALCF2SS1-7]|uniref:uncharacterized protein n=1 Tax=Lentinus tigrinus ALCF2SS1-7 TaxID=1328758 RepID=UPI00116629EF|nr:hypothetical protein L226DRAFT_521523 [Lentinus tigrinus ALCF2SS1-7]
MSEPIILALPDWVEQHITTLYKAKNDDDFNTAFDAFISHHVQVKVDGKPMSREQYKKLLMDEIKGDFQARVSFNGVVSVPDVTKPAIETGTVGAFFKAVITRTIPVSETTVTSSLNVVVSRDTSVKGNDNRRVTNLDEVRTVVPSPF